MSSPYYAPSNGQSEYAVKIVKNLLIKNQSNILISLLTYNSIPFRDGLSPTQLFLGRSLKTTVPKHPSLLKPSWPSFKKVSSSEKTHQQRQKQYFDNRHKAKLLPTLYKGDHVYIR